MPVMMEAQLKENLMTDITVAGKRFNESINRPIILIGMGGDGMDGLGSEAVKALESADIIYGGVRNLKSVQRLTQEKVAIKGDMGETIRSLRESLSGGKKVAVLASGDPFFYGIGKLLSEEFTADEIVTFPNLSSVQIAFSRIGETWEDAQVISLHGRKIKGLAQKIAKSRKVAILTDDVNTPAAICTYLKKFNLNRFQITLLENIGYPDEKITELNIEECRNCSTSALNIIILRSSETPGYGILGLDDTKLEKKEPLKGLITKKEIRALSISLMNLQKNSTVWDIGSGSGSISIEAARICTDGYVYAIERDVESCKIIENNMIASTVDAHIVHGIAPDVLEQLPDPDAVFIGGTGGNMESIIEYCLRRLKSGGKMIMNLTKMDSLSRSTEKLKELGIENTVTLVNISKSVSMRDSFRFSPLNPIFIVEVRKP